MQDYDYQSSRLTFSLVLRSQTLVNSGVTLAEFVKGANTEPFGLTFDDTTHIGQFEGVYHDQVYVVLRLPEHVATTNYRKECRIQYSPDGASWGNDEIIYFELTQYQNKYVPIGGDEGIYFRFIFDIGTNTPTAEDIITGSANALNVTPDNADEVVSLIKQPVLIAGPTVVNGAVATKDDYLWNVTLSSDGEVPTALDVTLLKIVDGVETVVGAQSITAGLALGAVVPVPFTGLAGAENSEIVSYVIEVSAK